MKQQDELADITIAIMLVATVIVVSIRACAGPAAFSAYSEGADE